MASRPALKGENLHKTFAGKHGAADVQALRGVSLSVASGGLTALVGPDGAGKTTLLRMAAGLLSADNGTMTVLDIDAAKDPQRIQDRIGYMPQRFGLYEDLSVQENLDLYADLHGVPAQERRQRFRQLLHMTDLQRFTDRPAGKLSGGMKQKLGLACTLVRAPELLLLDEPTVGVDPLSRRELWDIVRQLVDSQGLTVLVSTSYMDEAERCAHVCVLHQGQVLACGAPAQLRAKADGLCHMASPPDGVPARVLQARLLDARNVVADAVPEGGKVRYMLRPGAAPDAVASLLEGAHTEPAPPRLEDGFMLILRGMAPPGDAGPSADAGVPAANTMPAPASATPPATGTQSAATVETPAEAAPMAAPAAQERSPGPATAAPVGEAGGTAMMTTAMPAAAAPAGEAAGAATMTNAMPADPQSTASAEAGSPPAVTPASGPQSSQAHATGWLARLARALRLANRPAGPAGEAANAAPPQEAASSRHKATEQGNEPPMIEVRDLVRKFGGFTAVANTSFDVRRGEIFGLLGPNGAGKTTTFRMLCGLLPASSGDLKVAGVNLRHARAEARRKVGYVSQKFSLYGNLTVAENLRFFGGAYGLTGALLRERMQDVLRHFQLAGHEDVQSGQLPGGFRQRLAMAVGLLHGPEILFLDEPTSGADPLARRDFWRRITALAAHGVTIVVTTHFMEEAEYCDRIVIQDAGRVLALGTPRDVRAQAGNAAGMEQAFIAIVEHNRRQP